MAQLHGVISSIISCSISVLAIQLKRMSPNLGMGQIERRSMSPIVVFPFQDGAGIPVVHMEICWNSWTGANSLMPGTELQPHMKHRWHMPGMKTDAHKVPLNEILLLSRHSAVFTANAPFSQQLSMFGSH